MIALSEGHHVGVIAPESVARRPGYPRLGNAGRYPSAREPAQAGAPEGDSGAFASSPRGYDRDRVLAAVRFLQVPQNDSVDRIVFGASDKGVTPRLRAARIVGRGH